MIALGVAGLVLPFLQGVVMIAAGIALVGRRSLPIRWIRVRGRQWLIRRRNAGGRLGGAAAWLLEKYRGWRHRTHQRHLRRHARKLARGEETPA
jgi:hypothetical protein